jgi:hypothetical protein
MKHTILILAAGLAHMAPGFMIAIAALSGGMVAALAIAGAFAAFGALLVIHELLKV